MVNALAIDIEQEVYERDFVRFEAMQNVVVLFDDNVVLAEDVEILVVDEVVGELED